jgi:hypothetical protein
VIETANGTAKFEGELEEKELDLVIRIGLNYLLQAGALPIVEKGMGELAPLPEDLQ